ncbi:MAG: hypothetical protein HRU06_19020 [Oceanospirillaceae bacterium]|nr:hypothetical protein [Oceanospirillaceae bacterium]
MKVVFLVVLLCSLAVSHVAMASEVYIKDVKIAKNAKGLYSFNVTLLHADKSWDHYANVWQIETLSGTLLGKRVLLHPHINEQPFTRSINNIKIPKGVTTVVIRAGCTLDGINSKKYLIRL